MLDEKFIDELRKTLDRCASKAKELPLRVENWPQPQNPKDIVESQHIDFSSCFATGICIGIAPDMAGQLRRKSYQLYSLLNMYVYQYIEHEFREQGIGLEVERNEERIHMLGIFPNSRRQDFAEFYIRPILEKICKECGVKMCAGIGMLSSSAEQLKNADKTADYAFELYFFEQEEMIEFNRIDRSFHADIYDYDSVTDEAFRAVLMKKPDVLDKIDGVIDLIGDIHYGNSLAVRMRTMEYTGELATNLRRYRLLEGDFYAMQNQLQEKVLSSMTFKEMKQCIHEHYVELLPQIYKTDRPSSKMVVERVKSYIEENFMEDLSIEELSDFACVSKNYFSHMFKNETGVNYKTYLTNIRLEKAMQLLMESDYRLYEICEKVGYRNVRTFVDAFKKKYSMTPTSYRKMMMKK